MYDYIKGKLVSKLPMAAKGAAIVVENNGIGYFVHTTGRTVSLAGAENSDVKIYMWSAEDMITPYCFVAF